MRGVRVSPSCGINDESQERAGQVKEASRRRRQLGQSRYGLSGRGTACAKARKGESMCVSLRATG